jgi:RHS repeat-associated protein
MSRRFGLVLGMFLVLGAGLLSASTLKPVRMKKGRKTVPQTSESVPGQSSTLLPDGEILLLGGEGPQGPVSTAILKNPATGASTTLKTGLIQARAGHTATLLPNGTVLIFGGIGTSGKIESFTELFDPTAQRFSKFPSTNLAPRAYHTATVLTDGRVLVAGGVSDDGSAVRSIEAWDFRTNSTTNFSYGLLVPRSRHSATLQADGTVLFWGGLNNTGSPLNFGEIFDPVTQRTRMETAPTQLATNNQSPAIEASLPADNATDVSIGVLIAIRFSKLLSVATVNEQTLILSGSNDTVAATVVPAEKGMLAFVMPSVPLLPGTTYTLQLSGPTDGTNALEDTNISFTTAGTPPSSTGGTMGGGADPDDTGDQALNSPFRKLPPLQAPSGVTAIAGQALRLNGLPLENATLSIGSHSVKTDRTGRFLLSNIDSRHQVMLIDGGSADNGDKKYGIFEVGVAVIPGQTLALNYTIWMTRLDTENRIRIPSPTSEPDTIITTPRLPGLELHLPANTVIYDRNWKIVHEVSITPVPLDKPPFPLPSGVQVPIYFTIQPGGSYIEVNGGSGAYKGARLVYPNTYQYKPGTIFNFWNYDASQKGWYVYGNGKVSPNGLSVVPNPGVEIYGFTGAMVGGPSIPYPQGSTAFPPPVGGEPVDLSSGLFTYKKTDLVLPDLIPIVLRRTYVANTTAARSLGIGTMQDYDMFLVGDTTSYTYQELCLPDGARIYFYRTSSGTSYSNAVYAHTSTNSKWYGATITFTSGAKFASTDWTLTTRDGTNYYFPNGIGQTNPGKMALLGISDRHGNLLTVARDSSGNITQITSPSGRYIAFTHDTSNRLTQAQDNIGRTVSYTYDSGGRLSTATDANSGVTTYTYDSNDNMLTIKDALSVVYLTNQYDSNGRVTKQTLADSSTYQFAWTPASSTSMTYAESGGTSSLPPGGSATQVTAFRTCSTCSEGYLPLVSQVDVTDPNGIVREVAFGSTGQMTSDTYALGTSQQQAFTYVYYADNLVSSVTDQLGRVTAFSYDANGNVTQITRLSGTSSAVSTSFTYDSTFSQLASITDPLSHTISLSIDANGNTTTIADPLSHQTSLAYNSQGQVVGITDPLNHTTQFQYDAADLISVTDPLGRTVSEFHDSAGRLLVVQNPLGQTTRYTYDPLNQVTSVTDPISGQTTFAYDANGNFTGVTDANSHTTSYTYNSMDRLTSRTDPLSRMESYVYDGNGNLTQFTDRRGEVTSYTYDNLNRRTFAGFNTTTGPTYESTINNTYDAGNRLTQAVDSVTGTISRTYDGLDRMTEETTPQGSVNYTYDVAGRRTSMTAGTQSAVNYSYDSGNRLTQVAQGSATVSFAYDSANRRTSLVLPNGVTMSYGYDSGSQLSGISYTLGSSTLGNLTYSYDLAGRRTNVGGSYAATGLPSAVSTTAYDAANELTQWGSATPTYDANGNMLSDGSNSFVWSGRNHLGSMNMSGNSFQYDPFGRRVAKTVISTTTNYLYDGLNPVQELSGTTPTASLLAAGVDEYFTRTDSTGTANLLTDAMGSTLLLTDNSGSTLAQYSYEPFGKTTITGSSEPYQYTGRENDGTGVYFYRARYYSPTLQRFLSEDPLQFTAGPNFYEYAFNNPVTFEDPIGLSPMSGKACARRECHNVYQEAVYGNFVANSVLPRLSLFSYAPPVGGFPGNGHTLQAWGEAPAVAAKVYAVNALAGAASQNAAMGNWLTALSDLGTPLSGTIAAQGEAALATAAWQDAVVAGAEAAAPVTGAAVIAATIQDAYVWVHCW